MVIIKTILGIIGGITWAMVGLIGGVVGLGVGGVGCLLGIITATLIAVLFAVPLFVLVGLF